MKIAICTLDKDAYSETFIHAHARLLKEVVSFYHGGPLPTMLDNEPLARHLYSWQFLRGVLPPENWTKGFSLGQFFLLNSLKKTKPDCILAEYGSVAAAILPIVSHLRIPLVVHFHGFDISRHEVLNRMKTAYPLVFSYASALIAVSGAMKEKLSALGCPAEKLVCNPYGPADFFFSAQPRFDQPSFFGLGRFVEKKAPHLTLLAFEKVSRKHPEARLVLGGEGPLQSICIDLAEQMGIRDKVNFPGVLSHQSVKQHMEESIAFVQHSRVAPDGDMEGTPVGILEAQAAGLPVISTFHAGIPEVVLHEKTGLLGPEKDVNLMAELMIRLLENREEAREFGEAGRTHVRNQFSLSRHIEVLQSVLGNAVSQRKKYQN